MREEVFKALNKKDPSRRSFYYLLWSILNIKPEIDLVFQVTMSSLFASLIMYLLGLDVTYIPMFIILFTLLNEATYYPDTIGHWKMVFISINAVLLIEML